MAVSVPGTGGYQHHKEPLVPSIVYFVNLTSLASDKPSIAELHIRYAKLILPRWAPRVPRNYQKMVNCPLYGIKSGSNKLNSMNIHD